MKRGLQPQGYTIVEVMIFLVITGVLLASGIAVFRGRQEKTQFTQGVREFDSQLRGVINEVASGYYPNKANFNCSVSGGTMTITTPGTTQQGQNTGCIFLGRVLQFTNATSYKIYTVVGQQRTSSGQEVTALGTANDTAKQTLITVPNLIDTVAVPSSLTITKVVTPNAQQVGAIGLIASLGSYSGNDLVSGTGTVDIIPLIGTTLASNETNTVNETKGMLDSERNPGKIIICLNASSSGIGGRRAAIVLGGNNKKLGTEVIIDETLTECA